MIARLCVPCYLLHGGIYFLRGNGLRKYRVFVLAASEVILTCGHNVAIFANSGVSWNGDFSVIAGDFPLPTKFDMTESIKSRFSASISVFVVKIRHICEFDLFPDPVSERRLGSSVFQLIRLAALLG